MMNKKGQAALEFIMTYGWAILVVLIAISTLAYFGVLSPGSFLPSKCTLQSGLACTDFTVTATKINIRLANSLGQDMYQVNLSISKCGNTGVGVVPGVNIINGDSRNFNITCTPALTGKSYSGDVNVSWISVESGLVHKNSGVLTSKIEST